MQEKIKGLFGKSKEWLHNASKKTRILLGAGLVVILGAIAAIVVVLGMRQPYATLFAGLNQTDFQNVVSFLNDKGITEYKIEENNTILVPAEQADGLKAELALDNYPTSGYANSVYFDNIGTLTTESERNTLFLFNLEEKTEAVIRKMDGVYDADVGFTLGDDNTYVLDPDRTEAQAYVVVTMKDGEPMSDQLASAIRNIVSRPVQGLTVENITLVDSYGNPYGGEDDAFGEIESTSDLKLKLEQQVSNRVRTEVMKALTPIYGTENVHVSVSSVVNVDRSYTDSTDYTMEDWASDGSTGGENIIGSIIYDDQQVVETTTAGDTTTGADANADIPTYGENTEDGESTLVSSSGEKQYLVDTDKTQIERTSGRLTDLMVSVTITETEESTIGAADLYPHVARAAGIAAADQEEKISILLVPPQLPDIEEVPLEEQQSFLEWMVSLVDDFMALPLWAKIVVGVLMLLAILVLVVVILIVRRKIKRNRQRKEAQEAALLRAMEWQQEQQASQEGANIMEMQTERSVELRQDVRRFAENNPEIAAQMIRNWLKEGEEPQ